MEFTRSDLEEILGRRDAQNKVLIFRNNGFGKLKQLRNKNGDIQNMLTFEPIEIKNFFKTKIKKMLQLLLKNCY